jgi:hypothetical protein
MACRDAQLLQGCAVYATTTPMGAALFAGACLITARKAGACLITLGQRGGCHQRWMLQLVDLYFGVLQVAAGSRAR